MHTVVMDFKRGLMFNLCQSVLISEFNLLLTLPVSCCFVGVHRPERGKQGKWHDNCREQGSNREIKYPADAQASIKGCAFIHTEIAKIGLA
mgnify:FL=1